MKKNNSQQGDWRRVEVSDVAPPPALTIDDIRAAVANMKTHKPSEPAIAFIPRSLWDQVPAEKQPEVFGALPVFEHPYDETLIFVLDQPMTREESSKRYARLVRLA